MKEKQEQVIDKDIVNREMYQALCLNLEEKSDALGVLKNLVDKESHNGILGWWKLGRDVNSMTSQRLQSLAGKVYGPKRVKTYQDVPAAMEELEMHLTIRKIRTIFIGTNKTLEYPTNCSGRIGKRYH